MVSQITERKAAMIKEGNGKIIVKKAEEIEKEIKELIEKVSLVGKGIEILRIGLKKTSGTAAYNITLGVSEFQGEKCLGYFQKSLSQLKALEYYNFISRKTGYFTLSQYLRLKDRIREMKVLLSHSVKDLKLKERDGFFTTSMRMNDQPGFEKGGGAKFRLSP